MFQPETEDMLPRCAPKPSIPLDMNTAAIVRPTVPEVSILFGAQQSTTANSLPTTSSGATAVAPQQSYAAWKKQVLPKVTFPPLGSEVYSVNGHVVSSAGMSNATSSQTINQHTSIGGGSIQQTATPLYPLRPINATTVAPCARVQQQQQQQATTQMQQYRRSLEQPLYMQQQNTQETTQRRSFGECPISSRLQAITYAPPDTRDVLTICAGTQTDATLLAESPTSTNINPTHLANLVTKEEYQHIIALLSEMRMEQIRLTNAMESLLAQQQQQINPTHKMVQDASTQYTNLDMPYEAQVVRDEYEGIEEYGSGRLPPTAYDRYQPAYMLESSPAQQHNHPAAQSTAYQPHTPRITQTSTKTNAPMSNKPNNEKSMLMNELAMKYLPNQQLNELLQELNIGTPPTNSATPLRPIENLDKRPGDISNASYKYLKKYRLLPEEQQQQIEAKEQLTPVRSPLTHVGARQQQLSEQSPYQQQHTATPRSRTPQQQQQAPMLDLENIKRQPKLI